MVLFVLLDGGLAHAAADLYPQASREESLISIDRVGPVQEGKTWSYKIEVSNITSEVSGNSIEVIVEDLELREPLPPGLLLNLEDIRVSRGKHRLVSLPLDPCDPLRLDVIPGFGYGDSILTPAMKSVVAGWADLVSENDDLLLAGHADTFGQNALNRSISRERAHSVKQALIDQGLDESRIRVTGFGSSFPVTEAPTAQSINRRVVLYPASYPMLIWDLPELKPGQVATAEITFRSGSFYRGQDPESLLSQGDCLTRDINHRRVTPTLPILTLDYRVSQVASDGTEFVDPMRLAQCEPFRLQLELVNQGERSAEQPEVHTEIEPKVVIEGDEPVEQEQNTSSLVWAIGKLEKDEARTRSWTVLPIYQPKQKTVQVELRVSSDVKAQPSADISAEQILRLLRPQPTITVQEIPHNPFAGEWIDSRIEIGNAGQWPIYDLHVRAELSSALELEAETEQVKAWSEPPLDSGAQASLNFRFRANDNSADSPHRISIWAYDARYGDFNNNRCVVGYHEEVFYVKPIRPPILELSASDEVLGLGQQGRFQLRILNPNPISQDYNLRAEIDSHLWDLPDKVEVISADTESVALLVGKDDRTFELLDDTGKPLALRLAPQTEALIAFDVQALALDDQALNAIEGHLISRFRPAQLRTVVEAASGLVFSEAMSSMLLYQ